MSTSGPLVLEIFEKLPLGFSCGFWILILRSVTVPLFGFQWTNAFMCFLRNRLYSEKRVLKWPFCKIRCWQIFYATVTTNYHWQIPEEVWLLPSWQGATVALEHCWEVGIVFLVFTGHSCHSNSIGLAFCCRKQSGYCMLFLTVAALLQLNTVE